MPTFDFEKLDAFKLAMDAVESVDALAGTLPSGRSYIADQLRRAANSIALNIAEGAGEMSRREKARFYRMARRSTTECAGQLLVCQRLGLLSADHGELTLARLARVLGVLTRLVKALTAPGR